MSARDVSRWETTISEVISDGAEEEVVVRGRRLSELIGQVSFAEMMYFLLQGELPSPARARVLDGLLVAAMEHGIAPPSMIARCMASYGNPIQAAIAGGVLSFSDWMGGAGEEFARLLAEAVAQSDEDGLADAAGRMVAAARAEKRRIPGFGIPLHGADPRAPKLLALAREEGVYGAHCRLAELIEGDLESAAGRRIPMNLDGVGAALILDLEFPWGAARLFVIAPHTVSMAAHYLEEAEQKTRWRHVPGDAITYQGN